MNGRVDAGITLANEYETLIPREARAQRESTQLGEEGVAIFDPQCPVDPAVFVFN